MWTEEREAELMGLAGNDTPVSRDTIANIAAAMDITGRSASSKLRKMGVEVEKVAAKAKTFSDSEEEALVAFVGANEGLFTYAEIADNLAGGKFSAKQVQGKILSLELTDSVKKTPKKVVEKTYTDEEEEIFVRLANADAYIEDIAAKLNKPVNSVRGKALSLLKAERISGIPTQRDRVSRQKEDALAALGSDLINMTVAEVAEAIEKTERGIKIMLTRRGLACADYKGKQKKAA